MLWKVSACWRAATAFRPVKSIRLPPHRFILDTSGGLGQMLPYPLLRIEAERMGEPALPKARFSPRLEIRPGV